MTRMNPVLIVYKENRQVDKVSVRPGGLVIGRKVKGSRCDLLIDEDLASRKHAEIRLEEGAYLIRDLESVNGTSVKGKKVNDPVYLSDGDEIVIGSTRIKFLTDGDDEDDDKTRAARSESKEKPSPSSPSKGKQDSGPLTVTLRVTKGPMEGNEFPNPDFPLRIGKNKDENDLVLQDEMISRNHAEIIREFESFYLVDLESANGTFVNGRKLRAGKREILANGDQIVLGGAATLSFGIADVRKQRKILAIVLVCVALVSGGALAVKMLRPPDIAGQQIQSAQKLRRDGKLTEALAELQVALKIAPGRADVKRAVSSIEAELKALDLLRTAEAAAIAENYDEAKELVHQILREFPKNKDALALEDLIKKVEEARIAVEAQNWIDAVRLLEKAGSKFPKSTLLATQLELAQKELASQQAFARGKYAMDNLQTEIAEPALNEIPSNSVYFVQAKRMLDAIQRLKGVKSSLSGANAAYREGNLPAALDELDKGIALESDNVEIVALRERVRRVVELSAPLAVAEALDLSGGVEALRAGQKTCDELLSVEEDPQNAVRIRAQKARTRIDGLLLNLSGSLADQAERLSGAGDRKRAVELYRQAISASPLNRKAIDAEAKLRVQIVRECKKAYLDGLVMEELGNADEAVKRYRKVVELGVPGLLSPNDYFEKASRKLRIPIP